MIRFVRRSIAVLLLCGIWSSAMTDDEVATRVAVLDAVMVFGSVEQPVTPEEQQRLVWFSEQLRDALSRTDGYELVDHSGLDVLTESRSSGRRLDSCERCQATIGRELGAERVMLPVAYKMSELIMTLRIDIRDTENGGMVRQKTVRIAGNTDESWRRGRIALHRDMGIAGLVSDTE